MNKMYLKFDAKSGNEGFARTAVSAFMLSLNPTVEEVSDVKTAVSEAVTNAVVHAYPNGGDSGEIEIACKTENNELHIIVKDSGLGISNVSAALEPFYTTKQIDERSGMGFTVMRSFMDELQVSSVVNEGTVVTMKKSIKQ